MRACVCGGFDYYMQTELFWKAKQCDADACEQTQLAYYTADG